MAARDAVNRITEILRDSGSPWLLPNLRQDYFVWTALNDPVFLDIVLHSELNNPIDFSPGNLALLALDNEGARKSNIQQFRNPEVGQPFQVEAKSSNGNVNFGSATHELASAGVVALNWLDKYTISKTWSGFLPTLNVQLQHEWMTPIACLFGLLDQPIDLLRALVQLESTSLSAELAVHAILSNPLRPEDQVNMLSDICHDSAGNPLAPYIRLAVFRALSEARPSLAVNFSLRWLERNLEMNHQTTTTSGGEAQHFDQLLEYIFQVEISCDAGESVGMEGLLESELSAAENLYTSVTNHYLSRKISCTSKSLVQASTGDIYSQIYSLNKNRISKDLNPASQTRSALLLASQGHIDEAQELLLQAEDLFPDDIDVLYADARISLTKGDKARSEGAVSQINDLLKQNTRTLEATVWDEGFSYFNMGKLLFELERPSEAADLFMHALRICPNDERILEMLLQCYIKIPSIYHIVDILNILVSLNPSRKDYRRDYAHALEEVSDWESSLKEWTILLNSNQENVDQYTLSDKYQYARCAINAHQPVQAIKICDEILSQNQEDNQALIYSGEAHLLVNEIDKGMQLLTQATLVAPAQCEAWLALAEAQKKIYPKEKVIETLKNATLAAIGSAQIHYALGDMYLTTGEIELALPELQLATELAPQEPQTLARYGEALHQSGRDEESREIFGQAYRLRPELPGLAYTYAKILLESGAIEEAIGPLETLVDSKTAPEPGLYLEYARCIISLNKLRSTAYPPMKALIALNEVLQIEPDNAEATALTAEALTANGEYELAFQAYKEALDTSLSGDKEWFERLSYGFGCLASLMGKQDIAIAALQEASQVNPSNADIFMHLSESFLFANLPEDALRAARQVLTIDGENPDRLSWFARQVVRINEKIKLEIFSSYHSGSEEITAEAFSALTSAIKLAPTRIDLLVQLGYFQASIGDCTKAHDVFASIATSDYATISDLISASKFLSENGDHLAAIRCLEKGIVLDQSTDKKHDPVLYSYLATEYVKNNDPVSAISELDRAMEILPDDSSLVRSKIDILLCMGEPQNALEVIETTVSKNILRKQKIDLYILASKIKRDLGDFEACLTYSQKAITLANNKGNQQKASEFSIQHVSYLADLYRTLLQPERALQILEDERKPLPSDFECEQDYLDFIFLNTELALDTGGKIPPEIQEIQLESSDIRFCRLMAITARLMIKAGNYKQAEQFFQSGACQLNNLTNTDQQSPLLASISSRINLISLIDAAQEIGIWDIADTYAKLLIDAAPAEPLSILNKAKTSILKAEFDYLCDVFEVYKHKPSFDADQAEIYNTCEQCLIRAGEILENSQGIFILGGYKLADNQVNRWRARGEIIFSSKYIDNLNLSEILVSPATPGDTTAAIRFIQNNTLRDQSNDSFNRLAKLAQTYPRNPSVILQYALSIEERVPEEAIKSLRSVLEHNPNVNNPYIAFCNILLAKIELRLEEFQLASEEIEKAISFWPDEHPWHYLAAQVYLCANDINNAAKHLQEAVQLASSNNLYRIEFGRLLYQYANGDVDQINQARTLLKGALELEPHNSLVLSFLASIHFSLNLFEQAESYALTAIGQSPEQGELYQLLCRIYLKQGNLHGAYDCAIKAIEIEPHDNQANVLLAKSLSAMGKSDEALVMLDSLISLVHETKDLQLERINILRTINGPHIAIHELRTLAASYEDDFDILYALAKSFYEVGELENALGVAQKALQARTEKTLSSERADLHLIAGQISRQSGQLDPSIQHLNEAIQLAPNRLEPYLELGLARKERREYQQALTIFVQATTLAPEDPRALFQAGLALKESKDYKSSESMLRRAVSLAPKDPAIRRQLAAVVALNLIHNPRSARGSAK